MKKKNNNLVAVYGSLRKGQGNHSVINNKNSKFLGEFQTNPIYNLFAISSGFPGLKENGATSVVMEVYEVTDDVLESINILEGYDSNSDNNTFYNRIKIPTPFGEAYTYLYVPHACESLLIENGDWVTYKKETAI